MRLLLLGSWFMVLPWVTACSHVEKAKDESEPHFVIVDYNVLYGFNHGKSVGEGVAWIKQQNPDVVALQELNGFSQSRLEQTARLWGHPYADILKEEGFPVGLSSMEPIEVLEKRLDEMHHGFLHCKTSGIDFVVIHLSPFSFRKRRAEAEIICQKIQTLQEQKAQIVVLGDFNAVSPLDRGYLEGKTKLLEAMRKRERENAQIRNLDRGEFDFSAMQRFLDAGLKDPCVPWMKDCGGTAGTIPSRLKLAPGKDQNQSLRRIDFILLSPRLARRCIRASIPRDAVLDRISDHYPVVVTLSRERRNIRESRR